MVCRSCEPDGQYDFQITTVRHNPQVKSGEQYTIVVPVQNNNYFISAYCRVCLYEGAAVLVDSGSYKVKAREILEIVFTGTMPAYNLNLKASVIRESLGFVEHCNDAEYFTIPVGNTTIPVVTPDPTDPDKDDEDKDLGQWIMDNIVLVLILILVIIVILKFG